MILIRDSRARFIISGVRGAWPSGALGGSGALEALGARVIEMPVIRIQPTTASPQVSAAMAAMGQHDIVILTSPNGVDALGAAMVTTGHRHFRH